MRLHALALTALGLSSVVAACGGARQVASTPQPRGCAAALAAGPTTSEHDKLIARAQDAARRPATARDGLERLGFLYVSRARVNNDPGDYKLAEMTADCLDATSAGDPAALLLRGHVLHQLHRFHEAEQIARRLVTQRTTPLDYGLLGDALMEQGRLDEAASAYQRMLDLKPFYQSYTRAAHLRWLKGDLDGARAALQLAIDAASPRDQESAAWAWTRMSAYELQAERLDDALAAARRALATQPGYAAALLAEGRVQLARGETSAAVEVLRRAADANPLPEYQWALADALHASGAAAEADAVERELLRRGAVSDPRTFALFLATRGLDTARALQLTGDELRVRGDAFTLDAHAWALARSGRLAEAREVVTRALATGVSDARLFFHAGAILVAAGDRTAARPWIARAERARATLLPSELAALRALPRT